MRIRDKLLEQCLEQKREEFKKSKKPGPVPPPPPPYEKSKSYLAELRWWQAQVEAERLAKKRKKSLTSSSAFRETKEERQKREAIRKKHEAERKKKDPTRNIMRAAKRASNSN